MPTMIRKQFFQRNNCSWSKFFQHKRYRNVHLPWWHRAAGKGILFHPLFLFLPGFWTPSLPLPALRSLTCLKGYCYPNSVAQTPDGSAEWEIPNTNAFSSTDYLPFWGYLWSLCCWGHWANVADLHIKVQGLALGTKRANARTLVHQDGAYQQPPPARMWLQALKTERHTTLHINAQREWNEHIINGKGRRDRGSEEGKSRSWLCCLSAKPYLKNSPLETFSLSKNY